MQNITSNSRASKLAYDFFCGSPDTIHRARVRKTAPLSNYLWNALQQKGHSAPLTFPLCPQNRLMLITPYMHKLLYIITWTFSFCSAVMNTRKMQASKGQSLQWIQSIVVHTNTHTRTHVAASRLMSRVIFRPPLCGFSLIKFQCCPLDG